MNTLFVGRNMIELDSVDSTNSYANERLKNPVSRNPGAADRENLPEGTVIWTKNQTNGRGQRGNRWESKPFKNLAFSLILRPSFLAPDRQFYLNKVISLAVADFVSAIVKEKAQIKIKWPNDIYADDRKITGILIENAVRNNRIVHSVVGIGININQEKFSPAILNPVSLKLICGETLNPEECLTDLCSFLEARYLMLKSGDIEKVDESYRRLIYRYGEWSDFRLGEKRIQAKIVDISAEGKLIVETPDQKQVSCDFKEISFVVPV